MILSRTFDQTLYSKIVRKQLLEMPVAEATKEIQDIFHQKNAHQIDEEWGRALSNDEEVLTHIGLNASDILNERKVSPSFFIVWTIVLIVIVVLGKVIALLI
jgi:hypothetical protein